MKSTLFWMLLTGSLLVACSSNPEQAQTVSYPLLQKRLETVTKEEVAKEDIRCDGQDELVYSGHYKEIYLHNCHGVVLRDLVAESIELIGSEASLENVKLNASGTDLLVSDLVLTATLLEVDAKVGMVVDTSYLDLAGADFVTQDQLIEIQNSAQLYFSLSESQQGKQTVALHGVSLGSAFNVR